MLRKNFFIAFLIVCVFFLYFWYLVAHSFYDTDRDILQPFTTDQCTLLPNVSWRMCCVTHDKVYWRGGSAKDRLLADRMFRDCVERKTHSRILALGVYGAIRIGGVPYFALPWRWGYGWTFGRGYR